MITRIQVDGFKSLSGFGLQLRPGLNILVGPNGSGKTNVVSFFEFLTNLMDADASEATSQAGGAGAVFRRIEKKYEKEIVVRIEGCTPFPGQVRPQRKKKQQEAQFLCYQYEFRLIFPDAQDSVVFASQRTCARNSTSFVDSESKDQSEVSWAVDIRSTLDSEGNERLDIGSFEEEFVDYPVYSAKNTVAENKRELSKFIGNFLSHNLSLLNVLRRFSYSFSLIAEDVSAGHVYNIVPTRIKLPEDSAKPPGIGRDGSGLSSTLYAIQRSKQLDEMPAWFGGGRRKASFNPHSLSQLKQYLKVVNSAIEDIDVYNDSFDNQLRVAFLIRSGDYHASVPLALMSDGTLKWVALVTAALTARSVFSIEEPENYLHPQMQTRMVGILREILFRNSPFRMTLMTTHSETLLNYCRPEELIITSMVNGCTTAVRCTNPEEVTEEIRRTGFGLGYYYVADALEHG